MRKESARGLAARLGDVVGHIIAKREAEVDDARGPRAGLLVETFPQIS